MEADLLYIENFPPEIAFQMIDRLDNISIRSLMEVVQDENLLQYMEYLLDNRYSINFHREYSIDRSEFTTDIPDGLPLLRGIFGPVVAPPNGALAYFFNNGDFGLSDQRNADSPNLIDLLPLARQGIALRSTVNNLFYAHIYTSNLLDGKYITSTEVMNEAFGGTIPCLYLKQQTGTKTENKRVQGEDGDWTTIQVEKPVYKKIYNDYDLVNTYQAISNIKPEFNPNRFDIYYTQTISNLNLFSRDDLQNIDNLKPLHDLITEDRQVKAQMLLEYNIISGTLSVWREINSAKMVARRRG